VTRPEGFHSTMPSPFTAVCILWVVWFVSWLIAALWSARTVVRQPPSGRFAHSALIYGGALLLFGRQHVSRGLGEPPVPVPLWLSWPLVGVALSGFMFAWWARLHIGQLWSGSVTLKTDHAIVRSGPYGLTRHPIYTGLLLALVATALIEPGARAFVALALMVAGLLLKVRQEERLLTAHFSQAYEAYRSDVPALVPRLW
jgi:protein-S-isoprenylcysteine O-methyltransferase Ste14